MSRCNYLCNEDHHFASSRYFNEMCHLGVLFISIASLSLINHVFGHSFSFIRLASNKLNVGGLVCQLILGGLNYATLIRLLTLLHL